MGEFRRKLGGIPPLPQYLGFVSTGLYHPTAISASALQINSCSAHIAMDNITSLQGIWRNSYGSGQTPGASTIYRASVVYPANTYSQFTWSGATSFSAADGGDTPLGVATVNIPKGSLFFIRTFATNPNGVPYFGWQANLNAAMGSIGVGFQYGTSGLSDLTMGGPLTVQGGSTGTCGPVALLGQTTRPSILGLGDSISVGVGDLTLGNAPNTGLLARSIAPNFAISVAAAGGESLSTFIGASGNTRRSLSQYASHVLSAYGRNDMSSSGLIVSGNITTLSSLISGKKLLQTTITPQSTSINNWADGNGQTPSAAHANQIDINTRLRAGVSGVSGFIDVAKVVEYGFNSGIWIPNYVYLDGGGQHPNSACYDYIAKSGVFNPNQIRAA